MGKQRSGAWSITKGLIEENKSPLETAIREFREEIRFKVSGDFIEFSSLKQPSKKIVNAWVLEKNIDLTKVVSNTFDLEWPRNFGQIKEYS